MAINTAPKTVLVADANTAVTAHFSNLIRQAHGGQFTPVLAEVPDSESKLLRFSGGKLSALLRTQEFSAILLNGSPGLGGGVKIGDSIFIERKKTQKDKPEKDGCIDGRKILKGLRAGEYGALNQNAPVFSIFGDFRMEGTGTVLNNLTLDVERSGVGAALAGFAEKPAESGSQSRLTPADALPGDRNRSPITNCLGPAFQSLTD